MYTTEQHSMRCPSAEQWADWQSNTTINTEAAATHMQRQAVHELLAVDTFKQLES